MSISGFSETELRLGVFLLVFAALAALEWLSPRRRLGQLRRRRWPTNIGIAATGTLLLRLLASLALPLMAVAAAALAQDRGFGLLNLVGWPLWIEIVGAMVLLDLAIYLQHAASHWLPPLWRLHRVHHADRDFDVTTAIRFHPIEIGLSMLYKVALVLLLGPAPLAVLLFEITLNATAMFNHANVRLPGWLEAPLRAVIVTPDMHRVHHSVEGREHNSNFGFSLSIWDRLFKTYTPQPHDGHAGMTIGLGDYQSQRPAEFWWSLRLPFAPADSPDKPGKKPQVSE